jgi:hypothetical protein
MCLLPTNWEISLEIVGARSVVSWWRVLEKVLKKYFKTPHQLKSEILAVQSEFIYGVAAADFVEG